jgi:deazaflavin-dependent oxidoreductase (nitroreductase family)
MTTTIDPPPDQAVPGLPRAAFPPLAGPPVLEGGWARLQPFVRPAFIRLNRYLMIPIHRAGLGAWVATPVMGYMLLLRVRGRKSGLVREVPLSYLVAEGSAWVLAGFGRGTEWYRNLLADPHVEVILPGRRCEAVAEEVLDPTVRARIMPALVRATGLVGLTIGANPWTAGDEAVLRALDWIPLVRLRPVAGPIEAGADDPGGRGWIWRQALTGAASLFAWRVLRRLLPGR